MFAQADHALAESVLAGWDDEDQVALPTLRALRNVTQAHRDQPLFVLATPAMVLAGDALDAVLRDHDAPVHVLDFGGLAGRGTETRSDGTAGLPAGAFDAEILVQEDDTPSRTILLPEGEGNPWDEPVELRGTSRAGTRAHRITGNDVLEMLDEDGVPLWILAKDYDADWESETRGSGGSFKTGLLVRRRAEEIGQAIGELLGDADAAKFLAKKLAKRVIRSAAVLKRIVQYLEDGIAALRKRKELALPAQELGYETAASGRLLQVTAEGTIVEELDLNALRAQGPVLLLLHGTGKPAELGFEHLLGTAEHTPTQWRKDWRELHRRYQGRVLAYQHRQWSFSPIENAQDVVVQLRALGALEGPLAGRTFDLLSHSRGGLVGELLCAPASLAQDPLLQTLPKDEREALPGAVGQLTVGRFVRVAGSVRGSSLMSRRLDLYVSLMLRAIAAGLSLVFTAVAGTLVNALRALVSLALRVIKRPDVAPGLALQGPGTALVNLLQNTQQPGRGELLAVAGHRRKISLVSPVFLGHSTDGVVDTAYQWGGLERADDQARLLLRADTAHEQYFGVIETKRLTGKVEIDAMARPQIVAALSGQTPTVFLARSTRAQLDFRVRGLGSVISAARTAVNILRPLKAAQVNRAGVPTPAVPKGLRGTVVLLPGIMGSHLSRADDRLWVDPVSILAGETAQLRVRDGDGIDAPVALADFYQRFVNALSRQYRVLQVPYDWRLSPQADETVARLDRAVRWALDDDRRGPVHLVGHSMGGLVGRALKAKRPATWARVRDRGGRLLQMGTPNLGAFKLLRLLATGHDVLLALLNGIAVLQSHREGYPVDLRTVLRTMPGVLEMLPLVSAPGESVGAQPEWFKPAWWTGFRHQGRKVHPRKRALQAAWEAAKRLHDDASARDMAAAGELVYVAGSDDLTPDRVVDGRFLGVQDRGDGTVPWSMADVPESQTWYLPAVHERLLDAQGSYPGIQGLLEQGHTRRALPSPVPLGARGALSQKEETRGLPGVLTSTEPVSVEDVFVALSGQAAAASQAERRPVLLSVTHGNLTSARFAPVVGHYQGMTELNGPEAVVDRMVEGRLSAWVKHATYPGALGTHALVRSGKGRIQAVVVGLGEPGMLTHKELEHTLTRAFVAHVLDQDDESAAKGGVSCLLVGAQGGLSVGLLVRAIARAAVAAGDELADQSTAWLREVEIIELYQDRAVAANMAVQALRDSRQRTEGRRAVLEPAPGLGESGTGLRWRVDAPMDLAWPHRVQVEVREQRGVQSLRFRVGTQLARAELQEQEIDWVELSERLEALRKTASAGDAELEQARALFVQAVPRPLRPLLDLELPLLLSLDERAAQIPWELLRGSVDAAPPAVRFPLLRQFETSRFDTELRYETRPRVLVLGDLEQDHPLPFARIEAQDVAQVYRDQGWTTRVLLGGAADAAQITGALSENQVIHIAAHGVLVERKGRDGVFSVIGLPGQDQDRVPSDAHPSLNAAQGQVDKVPVRTLAARHFANLDPMPRLVFLNTCHSGRTLGAGSWRAGRYAPEMARALIERGVEVVVVSGWEVGDAAASTFAQSLYKRLLAGSTLAEAVVEGRYCAYLAHPNVDTWGAYQVYGDPGFRLVEPASTQYEPGSQLEVLARLEHARVGVGELKAEQLKQLPSSPLLTSVLANPDWRVDGQIAGEVGALLAAAWSHADALSMDERVELAAHGAAWLERAVSAERAAEARTLEQLLSHWTRVLRGIAASPDPEGLRWALAAHTTRVSAPAGAPTTGPLSSPEQVYDRLEALNAAMGKTGERLCLLASADKDLAERAVRSGSSDIRALKRAQRGYAEAAALLPDQLAPSAPAQRFYPAVNGAALLIPLALHQGASADWAAVRDQVDDARQIAIRAGHSWSAASSAQRCEAFQALIKALEQSDASVLGPALETYQEQRAYLLRRHQPNASQRRSSESFVRTLADLCTGYARTRRAAVLPIVDAWAALITGV